MPRNKQPPRGGQRAQITRAQLVYQLGGQPSTTPRPPAKPVPASTTPYIARRDIYNIAQSLPTSYAAHNGISSLGDLVIPSSLIPPGKTKFSQEEMTEIEKMLQDGTAFRLTSTTQEGRMAELKSGLRKMTGVQITDDMIECAAVPDSVRKEAEEAFNKQTHLSAMSQEKRMKMFKEAWDLVQAERAFERQAAAAAAQESWTKEAHPSDVPTEPNSPASSPPKTPKDKCKSEFTQAEIQYASTQVVEQYDSTGYITLLCNLRDKPSELSREVFENRSIVSPDSRGPMTQGDETVVLEKVARLFAKRSAAEDNDDGDDKDIRILTPSEVTAHAYEIIELFQEKTVIAKLRTFTPEELEAYVAATFMHGKDEEDEELYADEIAIMDQVVRFLTLVFNTLDEKEKQAAKAKVEGKGWEPYRRDARSGRKATANDHDQSTMSKAEINNLALHVIQGYDRAGYLAKLRRLNAEQIYRQVIQQGKRAPEDEEERAVLEEVVKRLIKRFGAKWDVESEGALAPTPSTAKGKSKGKEKIVSEQTLIPDGPLGSTGVIVAPGQTASQAVYAQWQKVKEQTKKWEVEGVRMKVYDVYVENGVVKKKLKQSCGMPGGRGGLR